MRFLNTQDALRMMIASSDSGDRRYRLRLMDAGVEFFWLRAENGGQWTTREADGATMPLDVAIMRAIQAAEWAFFGLSHVRYKVERWSMLEIVEAK